MLPDYPDQSSDCLEEIGPPESIRVLVLRRTHHSGIPIAEKHRLTDSEHLQSRDQFSGPDLTESVTHFVRVLAIVDLTRLAPGSGDDGDRSPDRGHRCKDPSHGDRFVVGMSVEREKAGH